MPVNDYSTTPASNSSINGINVAEGCAPGNLNNAIRQLMADVAAWRAGTPSTLFTGGGTLAGNYIFSGIVTFSTAFNVASGGTGAATFTANRILKGNGTSPISSSIVGDDGSTASVNGAFAVSGTTLLASSTTTGNGATTGDVVLEHGGARAGSGNAIVDLHGAAGGDFGARILRNGGIDGGLDLINSGAGDLRLFTNSIARAAISGAGVFTYGGLEVGYLDLPAAGSLTRGQCWHITGGQTIGTGLATGGVYAIYNNSASAVTLTEGSGLTLRRTGTTGTGNRTLAAYGYAWLRPISSTEYTITGDIS